MHNAEKEYITKSNHAHHVVHIGGNMARKKRENRLKNLKKIIKQEVCIVYGNTKKLLPILVLLAIFLAGCGGVTTPVSDETQIRNKIGQYSMAMSTKNWELAKSCCYPGSSAYLATEGIIAKLVTYPPSTTINFSLPIYSIDIKGNEAIAIVGGGLEICYQGECTTYSTGLGSMTFIKSGGEWYFYI